MTLRIVAGDRVMPRRFDSVREPIGSPVSRYASTTWRKISRDLWFNSETDMPLSRWCSRLVRVANLVVVLPIVNAADLYPGGRPV